MSSVWVLGYEPRYWAEDDSGYNIWGIYFSEQKAEDARDKQIAHYGNYFIWYITNYEVQ